MKHATRCWSGQRSLVGASRCLCLCWNNSCRFQRQLSGAAAQSPQVVCDAPEALQHQQQPSIQQQVAQLSSLLQQQSLQSITQQQQAHHSNSQQYQPQQHPDPEWPGLNTWRARGIDTRRQFGPTNKPTASIPEPAAAAAEALPLPSSLVGVALQVLNTAEPELKAALTHRGWKAYCAGSIPLHTAQPQDSVPESSRCSCNVPAGCRTHQQQPPNRPARPEKPELVIPKHVPSPKDSPLPLNAHMLHNLAHIELNAIDLAWDTVARYSHLQLPPGFYEDFARVADDESRHFAWCVQRMAELGHKYGDMPAHDLLWQGAYSSAGDLGARLAIVPMSQEARGLDAGKRLAERLVGAGDARSAAVVAAIALEERAHVAVGVTWFKRLCQAMGVDPPSSFRAWLSALGPELLKGPFNHEERQTVGLQRNWYDVTAWPEEQQQQMVNPALAAAARGKGLPVAAAQVLQQPTQSSNSSRVAGAAAAVAAVPQSGQQLDELRQRLWQMLEVEGAVCSS